MCAHQALRLAPGAGQGQGARLRPLLTAVVAERGAGMRRALARAESPQEALSSGAGHIAPPVRQLALQLQQGCVQMEALRRTMREAWGTLA